MKNKLRFFGLFVFSAITLLDFATDIFQAYSYKHDGDNFYFGWTLTFIIFPASLICIIGIAFGVYFKWSLLDNHEANIFQKVPLIALHLIGLGNVAWYLLLMQCHLHDVDDPILQFPVAIFTFINFVFEDIPQALLQIYITSKLNECSIGQGLTIGKSLVLAAVGPLAKGSYVFSVYRYVLSRREDAGEANDGGDGGGGNRDRTGSDALKEFMSQRSFGHNMTLLGGMLFLPIFLTSRLMALGILGAIQHWSIPVFGLFVVYAELALILAVLLFKEMKEKLRRGGFTKGIIICAFLQTLILVACVALPLDWMLTPDADASTNITSTTIFVNSTSPMPLNFRDEGGKSRDATERLPSLTKSSMLSSFANRSYYEREGDPNPRSSDDDAVGGAFLSPETAYDATSDAVEDFWQTLLDAWRMLWFTPLQRKWTIGIFIIVSAIASYLLYALLILLSKFGERKNSSSSSGGEEGKGKREVGSGDGKKKKKKKRDEGDEKKENGKKRDGEGRKYEVGKGKKNEESRNDASGEEKGKSRRKEKAGSVVSMSYRKKEAADADAAAPIAAAPIAAAPFAAATTTTLDNLGFRSSLDSIPNNSSVRSSVGLLFLPGGIPGRIVGSSVVTTSSEGGRHSRMYHSKF